MAVRQAKVISRAQFDRLITEVRRQGDNVLRGEVALRLSFFAGLRAGEIAKLRWDDNILTSAGEVGPVLHITTNVGKKSTARVIPIDDSLKESLIALRAERPDDEYVFYAAHNNIVPTKARAVSGGKQRRGPVKGWAPGQVTPNAVVQWFKRLYALVGFQGCTSHSGRRTFITSRARVANLLGSSLKDVQALAGHKRIETTGRYIEPSDNQHALVSAWKD